MQVKLRASINKNMLNSGEQHLQLPKKGLSAEQITGSLEKRVCYSQQQYHCCPCICLIISFCRPGQCTPTHFQILCRAPNEELCGVAT